MSYERWALRREIRQRLAAPALREQLVPRNQQQIDGDAGNRDLTDEALTKARALELAGGGKLDLPGGAYTLTEDLVLPEPPCVVQGTAFEITILTFAAGKGLKITSPRCTLRDLTVNGTRLRLPEITANHDCAVGDRFRSALDPLASGSIRDVDLGVHIRCTVAGRTANTTIGSNRPGVTFQNGTATFVVEAWAGIDVKGSYCLFENVGVNFFDDCGFFIHGQVVNGVNDGIADANTYINCRVTSVDGHGYFVNGDDGNRNLFLNCWAQDVPRGVGGYDTGFLANRWIECGAVNARRSFQAPNKPWPSVFDGIYQENVGDEALIESPNVVQFAAGGYSRDSRLSGRRDNGVVFEGGLNARGLDGVQIELGGPQGLVATQVPGDIGMIASKLLLRSDDPVGVLREAWNLSPYAVAVDRLMPRSAIAPGKLRYPQGFFLGEDVEGNRMARHFPLPHKPGPDDLRATSTRIYHAGDVCWNTAPGAPLAWKATQDAGWGGGLASADRIWKARNAALVGEGIEPSDPLQTRVYVATWLEVQTSPGVWVRDPSRTLFYLALDPQAVEPDWASKPNVGDVIYETVSTAVINDRRVRWLCWSAIVDPDVLWEAM